MLNTSFPFENHGACEPSLRNLQKKISSIHASDFVSFGTEEAKRLDLRTLKCHGEF